MEAMGMTNETSPFHVLPCVGNGQNVGRTSIKRKVLMNEISPHQDLSLF